MNESDFQRVMRALGERFQRLRHEADTSDGVPDTSAVAAERQIEAINEGFGRVVEAIDHLREEMKLLQPGRAA